MDKQYQGQIDALAESVKRIHEHAGQTGEKSGTVECPKCGGRLNYTLLHSRYIWAKCEIPECLHIMQ